MQLLRALEDPSFLVIVHLDENSSQGYKDVVTSMVGRLEHARLAISPVPCSWGGTDPSVLSPGHLTQAS